MATLRQTNTVPPIWYWVPDAGGGVEVDPIIIAMLGQPNGVAQLDGTGKVPLSQLPSFGGTETDPVFGAWLVSDYIGEAPTDGQVYGRCDGAWSVASGGSGGSGIIVADTGTGSTVRCGLGNCACGDYSNVSSGCGNTVSCYGIASTISGGVGNTVSGACSFS